MPKLTEERIIDLPFDQSLRRAAGRSSTGTGGGPGGGVTYTAGDAIDITGTVISVKREATGAIGLGANNGLRINVGNGLTLDSNDVVVALASNPGLEFDTAALRVKVSDGIARGSSGISVDLAADPGLEFDGGKIRVKAYHGINRDSNGIGVKLKATSGLGVDSDGLAVGAGDGIDVFTSTVAVDVTDIINTSYGIYEPTPNDIGIKLATHSGLTFDVGALTLGTPTTLTYATTNAVSGASHSHAITSSSNVGNPAATSLLRADNGDLTLADLTLYGNLTFAGADRSILASNNLTIAPSTDLILDPTGLVVIPVGQEIRSGTFNDFVAGISGFRHWDRGGNYRQLTIGAIKADELFVRFFTADESRVNRGEEFWTRSYGIVETEFTVPADEATVDVWFEEVPALGSAKLFLPDNWILVRQIDIDTGLLVQKIWFQVVDAGANDYVTRQDADDATGRLARQQWRLRRKSGGETGATIRKGNVAVDFGKPFTATTPLPGQGVVHLSALAQDGGPFVQIQTFESVSSDVPQFKNRVRMGNLSGTVDYSTDTFGLAAGNDTSLTPSTGFSGQTIEATNGLRMFNTDIFLYTGSTLTMKLTRTDGLSLLRDTGSWSAGASTDQSIRWWQSLGTLSTSPTGLAAQIGLWNNGLILESYQNIWLWADSSELLMEQDGDWNAAGKDVTFDLSGQMTITADDLIVNADSITVNVPGVVRLHRAGLRLWDIGIDTSDSGNPLAISSQQDFDSIEMRLHTNSTLEINTINPLDATALRLNGSDGDPGITVWAGGQVLIGAATGTDANAGLGVYSLASKSASGWKNVAMFGSSDTTNQLVLSIAQFGSATSSLRRMGINASESGVAWLPLVLQSNNNALHIGPIADSYVPQGVTITTDLGTQVVGTTDAVRIGVLAGTPRVAWQDGSSAWMIDNDEGDLRIYTPGVVHATFNSTGALGIGKSPVSRLHVYQNDSGVSSGTGITVEQDGSGDALVQFLLTNIQRWVIGIDQSAGSVFRFSPSLDLSSNPVFQIAPNGTVNIGGTTTEARLETISSDTTDPDAWPLLRSVSIGQPRFNLLACRALMSGGSAVAVGNGQALLAIGAMGMTSSGWGGASGQIAFQSVEPFTSTAQGTKFLLHVTKSGTTTVAIGLEIGHDRQFIAPGVYAHTTGDPANVNVQTTSGWLRRSTSSERYKQDITPLATGDLIDHIQPVTYRNREGHGDTARLYPGFVAEQLVGVGGDLFVGFDEQGKPQSVYYDRLTALLTLEVQKLRRRVADLEGRLN